MKQNGASESETHLEIIKNASGVAFAGTSPSSSRENLRLFHDHQRVLTLYVLLDVNRFDQPNTLVAQTVSTVLSAILAFVLYPEVLAKAQAELDNVVGQCRLPNFDDRPQLPYIDAILSEALRWNPVVPMGDYSSYDTHDFRAYHSFRHSPPLREG